MVYKSVLNSFFWRAACVTATSVILISALGAPSLGAPVAETTASSGVDIDQKPGWALVWSDEFEGAAIDPTKWSREVDCWGGGNKEKQCYTADPKNAFVRDGKLHIVAHKGDTTGPFWPGRMQDRLPKSELQKQATLPYSSARLVTNGHEDWRFGRFEIRAKLPMGQGTWPAIWMLPSDDFYGNWAASGEIDILETVNLGTTCNDCDGGLENMIFGTLHYGGGWPKNTHKGNETKLPESADGFHVFAIEWQAGQIDWFVDGHRYGTLTQDDWHTTSDKAKGRPAAPFDQPFYLVLNLAIGGLLSEEHNDLGVDPSGFPKELTVDWVRVYEREGQDND